VRQADGPDCVIAYVRSLKELDRRQAGDADGVSAQSGGVGTGSRPVAVVLTL